MGAKVAFWCTLELICIADVVGCSLAFVQAVELFCGPEVVGCSVSFGCTLELSCGAEVVGAIVVEELVCGAEAKVVGCPVEITWVPPKVVGPCIICVEIC